MDEKSPRVQPTRHRSVFRPARFHTALDAQNCDENIEGGSIFPSFLLHGAFGELLVHFGRSWNAVAGVIFLKELQWIRPEGTRRVENLNIIDCMANTVDSMSAITEFGSETLLEVYNDQKMIKMTMGLVAL